LTETRVDIEEEIDGLGEHARLAERHGETAALTVRLIHNDARLWSILLQ